MNQVSEEWNEQPYFDLGRVCVDDQDVCDATNAVRDDLERAGFADYRIRLAIEAVKRGAKSAWRGL